MKIGRIKKYYLTAAFCVATTYGFAANTSTSQNSAQGTSSVSVETVQPESSKNWGVNLLGIVTRNSLTNDQIVIMKDKDGADNATYELDINLSYKLNKDWSVKGQQRIFYSDMIYADKQENAAFGNLRLYLTQKNIELWGSKPEATSLSYRVTLPTVLETRRDTHSIGTLALLPAINWGIGTSRWGVSYEGLFQVTFFDGEDRTTTASAFNKTMAADMRTMGLMNNVVSLNYEINPRWSVSQSVGHTYFGKNSSNPKYNFMANNNESSRGWNYWGSFGELTTTVNWNPLKEVSVSLYVAQNAPLTQATSTYDPQVFVHYADQYALYRPMQTTYNLTTSLTF